MQELDCVEVIVEKDIYTKHGVHKGMQGWICDERCINGMWLVNFPRYGLEDDIGTIAVKQEDLCVLDSGINAMGNQEIYSQFSKRKCEESADSKTDDISDYLV